MVDEQYWSCSTKRHRVFRYPAQYDVVIGAANPVTDPRWRSR
jgi:hypothetical protein